MSRRFLSRTQGVRKFLLMIFRQSYRLIRLQNHLIALLIPVLPRFTKSHAKDDWVHIKVHGRIATIEVFLYWFKPESFVEPHRFPLRVNGYVSAPNVFGDLIDLAYGCQ
jgi:hypothetical protein